MRNALLALVAAAAPVPALAQVTVTLTAPTIRFEAAPPLVVVEEGVQVVPDYDEEIFFVGGHYWHRSGPHWWRSPVHTGGWVLVEPAGVPPTLVRIKPGHYRRWKARAVVTPAVVAPGVVVPVPGVVAPGKVKVKHGKVKVKIK